MDIDFAAKTATCKVVPGKFNPQAAIDALAQAEFPGSTVRAAKE